MTDHELAAACAELTEIEHALRVAADSIDAIEAEAARVTLRLVVPAKRAFETWITGRAIRAHQ